MQPTTAAATTPRRAHRGRSRRAQEFGGVTVTRAAHLLRLADRPKSVTPIAQFLLLGPAKAADLAAFVKGNREAEMEALLAVATDHVANLVEYLAPDRRRWLFLLDESGQAPVGGRGYQVGL